MQLDIWGIIAIVIVVVGVIGGIIIFAVVGIALAGCLVYGIIDSKKNTNK